MIPNGIETDCFLLAAKCHIGSRPVKAGAVARCYAALTGRKRCGKKPTRGSNPPLRRHMPAKTIRTGFFQKWNIIRMLINIKKGSKKRINSTSQSLLALIMC